MLANPPGQDAEWQKHMETAEAAGRAGDMATAESELRAALAAAEATLADDDPRLIRTLRALASCLSNLQRLEQAEFFLRRALALGTAKSEEGEEEEGAAEDAPEDQGDLLAEDGVDEEDLTEEDLIDLLGHEDEDEEKP